MTPQQFKDSYGRLMKERGEIVSLRRGLTDYAVRACVLSFNPDGNAAAEMQETIRHVVVLADDVAAAGFPLPFLPKQDRMIWNGRTLVITAIDDGMRRIAGVTVAYDLEVAGA